MHTNEVLWILKDEPQTCVSASVQQLEGEGVAAGPSLASTVSLWDAEISGTGVGFSRKLFA